MAIIPQQFRSIDPWSENRFSDNYNLRSRMLTGGHDCVIFLDSFNMAITSSPPSPPVLVIGPGLAIKDDVMIHILEDTTMNLTVAEGYVYNNIGDTPIIPMNALQGLNIVLTYQYARSMPSPTATINIIKDNLMLSIFRPVKHMWLGRIIVVNQQVTEISRAPIRFPLAPIPNPDTRTIYYRRTIDPLLGYTTINGGVIRPLIAGDPVVNASWFEEWTDV